MAIINQHKKMEDHFEIHFVLAGKQYAGTVYPDHIDKKIHYQLHYHAREDGNSSIVFIEPGERIHDVSGPAWVQRIAAGEKHFLSSEFLQAAGAAIEERNSN